MDRRAVSLQIAGHKYRVISSVGEKELHRLAEIVGSKLAELVPAGRPQPPEQAMLLAAIALAHEVELERGRRESLEQRTSELLQRILARIDDALRSPDNVEAADQP